MPYAQSAGAKLYFEEAGSGHPLLFVHEFAGDHRSWEAQMRFFARRYRCIAYNARGYPPSDVPEDVTSYRQEQQADDELMPAPRVVSAGAVRLERTAELRLRERRDLRRQAGLDRRVVERAHGVGEFGEQCRVIAIL